MTLPDASFATMEKGKEESVRMRPGRLALEKWREKYQTVEFIRAVEMRRKKMKMIRRSCACAVWKRKDRKEAGAVI